MKELLRGAKKHSYFLIDNYEHFSLDFKKFLSKKNFPLIRNYFP